MSGLPLAGLMLVFSGCDPLPPEHGIALVVALETNNLGSPVDKAEHIGLTEQVLRKRLRDSGYGFSVDRDAEGEMLVVKLPDLASNEMASARRLISRSGLLQFRLVHPESADLIANDIGEPGFDVMTLTNKFGSERLLVGRKPEQGLTGKYIRRAYVSRNSMTNEPEIMFELDKEGAAIFAMVTKANVGHRLAIMFDGVLYSAPIIQSEIPHGRGLITGKFTVREALDLANLLENPIEVPHRIIEERRF